MASALFDPGREGFLSNEIIWKTGTASIKAVLCRGYTFNATHKFLSDVQGAGATLSSASPTFTSQSNTSGVADAGDITFTSVPSNASAFTSVIIYQSSAVTGGSDVLATAQRLIAYIDTATGIPVTPNGQNITVSWDNGSNRIFKL